MSNYLPLHTHSCGSIRDSTLKLKDYISIGKELNLSSLAVTDHGFSGFLYKHYKLCKENNIKPILGQEFYYVPNEECKTNYHILVIAKNNIGLKNLFKLSSIAYLQNFYKKPRIWKKALFEYSEGLIVSTACCFSHFGQLILEDKKDEALSELQDFSNHFKDDFYLELMNHGLEEEVPIRQFYREINKKLGNKIIATNDSHYGRKDEKELHNIFKQIAYGSVGKDKDDSFNGDGYHILSYEEMLERFEREEIDNTNEIAEKCNISFNFIGYHLPNFDIPNKEQDSYEYLKDICYKGLKEKGLDDKKEYIDRLEYELNQIHISNLEGYILIVADYLCYGKNNNMPIGLGRGSSGASLVCYLTKITEIDPLYYKLPFSRFLNSGRIMQYDFGL